MPRLRSLVFSPAVATVTSAVEVFPRCVDELKAFVTNANADAETAVADLGQTNGSKDFIGARKADLAAADYSARLGVIAVVKNVAVDKEMRDAATTALVEMQAKSIDLFTSNRAIYRLLKSVTAPSVDADADAKSVEAQQRYWLDDKIAEYERDGHGLPDDKFDEVVKLKKELAALSTAFMTRVSEDKTTLVFTKEQLAGVPESILSSLTKAGESPNVAKDVAEANPDGLAVGLDYPTYFGIMKNCTVAETRHTVGRAFAQRASSLAGSEGNEATLAHVVKGRHALAKLLGFATYAELDLASKMAKTPATAQAFIDELLPGLQRKWLREASILKEHLPSSVTLNSDGSFSPYDISFVMNQYKREHLNVDEQEIQNYFPMENTVSVLLTIYERFFDVRFIHHENDESNKLGLWHKTATVIEVRDRRADDQLIGHIILDLYPREGKYSHACCHAAIPAVRQESESDNSVTPALSVVLANFPSPTAGRPSLLLHSDAETFFHEFGHAMHGMFGRAAMATHAGTRVKRDFVELPSQILEEWLWTPTILKMVTKHYQTGEPIPENLMKKKIQSKRFFSGYESLRQLQFATLSLNLFGEPRDADPDRYFSQDVQPRIMPGIAYDGAARFTCSFGHLMGYAATYYGYMWSEVFAADVFQAIEDQDGLLDASVGRRYAESILSVGGGRDPEDMLKEFLGRPANNAAFLKSLGIDVKA
jgi:thimet oligopeptidase